MVTHRRSSLSGTARAEIAAETTARTVRALAEEELTLRQEKTERLREARLARDAADPARHPSTEAQAKTPPGPRTTGPDLKEVPSE